MTRLCCPLQRRKESSEFSCKLTHSASCKMQRASHTIYVPLHGLVSSGSAIRNGSKDSSARAYRSYYSFKIVVCD